MTQDQQPDAVALLCMSASSAYTMSFGCPDQRAFPWFTNPLFGTLVFEVSAGARALHKRDYALLAQCIGYLQTIAWESFHTDEEWEKIKHEWEGAPRPSEKVFYIKCLTGGEVRWTNADFIRIPEVPAPWRTL